MTEKLVKIGVFYDGNFLFHISNYYLYHHARKSRVSIGGMHGFIRTKVASDLGVDGNLCQIVDIHYFRGRVPCSDANKESVYKERMFEDVLVREGVTTHFLPVNSSAEKGVDVLFALEAYEAALVRKLDVIVLVASDGDFVPLVRKISAAGVTTVLIGCDFEFTDESGSTRTTRTSQRLIDEVSFPILLNEVIDKVDGESDITEEVLKELFVTKKERKIPAFDSGPMKEGTFKGRIQNTLNGYGFITPGTPSPVGPDQNVFFHFKDVSSEEADLRVGDMVSFQMGKNDRGPCAVDVVFIGEDE